MFCNSAAAAGAQRIRILGAQLLVKAGVHFFFNELAPFGQCDTCPDGGAKAGLFMKQTQGYVLHQLLGVGASMGGDLGKLSFLLGCEMYFHTFQDKGKAALEQPQKPRQKSGACPAGG